MDKTKNESFVRVQWQIGPVLHHVYFQDQRSEFFGPWVQDPVPVQVVYDETTGEGFTSIILQNEQAYRAFGLSCIIVYNIAGSVFLHSLTFSYLFSKYKRINIVP